MARGKFIVIDGMDGSGKGTQIAMLKEKLQDRGVLFTREPGGSPRAEEIREMILNGITLSNPVCDFFLFLAARGSHIEDVVAPALGAGRHVICDRYDSSTFAFQLRAEQMEKWLERLFDAVRAELPSYYRPDLYIFLDLPAEVAYARRAADAAQTKNKFDIKPLDYHERVREGFREFKERFGPAVLVDADRPPEAIQKDIWTQVEQLLG